MADVSYRALLLEDDPVLIRAISDLLRGQGYLLDVSSNREFALQMGLDEQKVRVEGLLRPAAQKPSHPSFFRFGSVKVNFRKSEIVRNGFKVLLSERESRLLQFLIENRGTVVSRDTLLENVWGYPRPPFTRTVDVTILRLRQKIEQDPSCPQFIVTVHGFGYRFDG